MPVDSLGFGWLVGRCGLCFWSRLPGRRCLRFCSTTAASAEQCQSVLGVEGEDRKSTRLNSSHVAISYAVFCLKKKNQIIVSHLRLHYGVRTQLQRAIRRIE